MKPVEETITKAPTQVRATTEQRVDHAQKAVETVGQMLRELAGSTGTKLIERSTPLRMTGVNE